MSDMIPIIFSTITGNAFKLAEAVRPAVPDPCGPYNIRYVNDEMIEKFDTFVLVYWCDRGSADPDTLALIERLHGKRLIVLGTLGAARDSRHAEDVSRRVSEIAARDNTLLGHFLCQGSIDLCRTARKLREGKLSPERFEKQKLALSHPDETDLADARAAVAEFLQ